LVADHEEMPDLWPLLINSAGLIAPWLGSFLFLSGFDRFRRGHQDEFPTASGREMARVEKRMWGLPVGALVLGPVLVVAGIVGSSGFSCRRRLMGHGPRLTPGPVFATVP
jgi:hypothetical protein